MSKQAQNERLIQQLQRQIAQLQRENQQCRSVQQAMLEEQQRLQKLAKAHAAVTQVSAMLVAQSNLSAFLEFVTQEAIAQLGADAGHVTIVNEQCQTLQTLAHVEQDRVILIPPLAVQMPMHEADFIAVILETGKPRCFDLDQEAHLFWTADVEYHWQRQHCQVTAVPLFAQHKFVGHLELAFTDKKTISSEEIELLQALAHLAAVAIHLTQLSELAQIAVIAREQEKAAQERVAELAKANDALRRSVDVLATESDLNQFIGHLLRVTAEQFDAPLAEYWQVINPNIGQVVGWWGHNRIHGFGEEHNHPAKEPGVCFPAYMLEDGQVSTRRTHFVAPFDHSVEPAQGEFPCDPEAWYATYDAHWQLNLPLVVKQTCFGIIIFWLPSDRSFTKQQIELGYALAQQMTLAIRLCQLADEAKLSAVVREQEKAAQEQATELAKANQALKRSIIHLTTAKTLHSFLVAVLQEACQASGATCASIFVYEASSNALQMKTLILDNQVIDIATDPRPAIWHSPVPADITKAWQMMSQEQKIFWSSNDNPAPEHWQMSTVWHQQMQHKAIAAIPLLIGEQALGFLGLYFTTAEQPSQSKIEQCSTLAQHAALALQMAQLAEQGKHEAEQAAILQERNRIAREIHDTLAQCLTGIIIQLQAATDSHTANPLNHIATAIEIAKSGLIEARRSVRALRPQVLEAVSLDTALAQLVSQIHSDELHSNCRILGTPYTLPVEVESNLLRIAQEAVTNCIRHAKATQVKLELVYQPEQVTLRIKDNGCGFLTNLPTQGYGLVGMHERARAIAANLTITSQPNEGTDVAIVLSISLLPT